MSKSTEYNLSVLIPAPKKVTKEDGEFTITGVRTDYAPFAELANTLSISVEKIFDKKIISAGEGNVVLLCDPTLPKGKYILDAMGDEAVIYACDDEGISYGIATVLSIMVYENDLLQIHKARVEDAPDKDYRTLMIDLDSEWHPANQVYRYIDVCFMLKIRYLHIHFMDTRRYTLPSRIFPNLTKFNRHYTFEDIESFRKYASSHGVILVPEFEVPGHATIMIKAYPEIFGLKLTGNHEDANITTESGEVINANGIVCAGSEVCMNAVRALLAEICEMFPESPYIHIGGDEANIKAWNYCTDCLKYMEENNISDVKELYSEFTGRVAQTVLDLGKIPIVWEGFPKEGVHHIPKETIVIAWESHYHMAYDLLKEGFRIINASWQPLYIVNSYTLRWNSSHIFNWDVYNWQHWWGKSEATLNPIHVQATDQLLGAQICSWLCTYDQEISEIVENLSALSERTWNVRRSCSYERFAERMNPVLHRIFRFIQEV